MNKNRVNKKNIENSRDSLNFMSVNERRRKIFVHTKSNNNQIKTKNLIKKTIKFI